MSEFVDEIAAVEFDGAAKYGQAAGGLGQVEMRRAFGLVPFGTQADRDGKFDQFANRIRDHMARWPAMPPPVT